MLQFWLNYKLKSPFIDTNYCTLHLLSKGNTKFALFAYDYNYIYKQHSPLLKYAFHIMLREEVVVVCRIYLHVLTQIYIYYPQTHDLHYISCSTESNDIIHITYPYLRFCHFSPVNNIKIIPIHYIFLVARYVLACVLSMYFLPYILTCPLSTKKTTPKLTSWMDK